MSQPLGLRLNNPLNIRVGGDWRGLTPKPLDPKFCSFINPMYGLRAGARILVNYYNKHRINTTRGVITRWAPPSDGNDVESYILAVETVAGFAPDLPINLSDTEVLEKLIPAMVVQESGGNPYPGYLYSDAILLGMVSD